MNRDMLKSWNKITRHKIKVFLNISIVNWIIKSGVNLSMPYCCATLLPFYPLSKLFSWAAFCFLAPQLCPWLRFRLISFKIFMSLLIS